MGDGCPVPLSMKRDGMGDGCPVPLSMKRDGMGDGCPVPLSINRYPTHFWISGLSWTIK